MASISSEQVLKKVHAGATEKWPLKVSCEGSKAKISFSITTGPGDSAPDWDVMLSDSTRTELWSNYRSSTEVEVDTPGKGRKELLVSVICPKGARYGDTVDIVLTADDGSSDSVEYRAVATQSVMILKTKIDQEREVANTLASKANLGEKDIYAILSPAGLRGYVFVEGMNTDRLREKTRDIKKAGQFIDGETSIEEISPYLTPVSAVVGIVEGDIVELVNGPFKGEKARVQQIDEDKEEITVELIEAMVPIPVTVKGDSVRVIEKER